MSTPRDLQRAVVDKGLCIGCGACAALKDSAFTMRMTETGRYEATLREGADLDAEGPYTRVCPFSAEHDEDDLSKVFLDADDADFDAQIGSFRQLGAGHVTSGGFRENGSSGGFTTWFIDRLFAEDLIDAVLHVKPRGADHPSQPLFAYGVSHSTGDAQAGSKTRYYPVEMSEAIAHVRDNPGRYAVVGVPCFIKGIRLLQLEDEEIRERIRFCIGIVCGHLKSTRFADTLAWQQGVAPGDLRAIDFREKSETRADHYKITVTDADGSVSTRFNYELKASDWGIGLFKYRACDYCDDVLNETADIATGDAWLPGYSSDPAGANIVIARSEEAVRILNDHSAEVHLEEISAETAARSQAGGLRHRREGLAYRLGKDIARGEHPPRKRVAPSTRIPRSRRRLYDLRSAFIDAGDAAFDAAGRDYESFSARLQPLFDDYRAAYYSGFLNTVKYTLRTKAPGLTARLKRLLKR